MAESQIGINPGSTVQTGSLTDGSGNQVPKVVITYSTAGVPVNVSSTSALPVTGTVTISTAGPYLVNIGTGTALIGQVISPATVTIFNGTAALAPMYASVSFTASLGNTVIAGIANKNIYVLSGVLVASTATNLQFWSTSTAGTAISGVMAMTANMGFTLPYCPIGHMVTQATGQPIQISTSASGTVGGWLTYVAY